MLPIEWWFEKDPADEVKPDPWNLPPLYVDEEEEELARLSKGFENDRLFISFEANPKLLKQYLLDPQGFRDRLPPPKKEDTSWHYRSWDPNSTAFRVSKEGRRTRKRSEVASDERSTKKSEAANKQEERPEGESPTPAPTPPTSDAGGLKGNQQNEAVEPTTETHSSPHTGRTLPKPERLTEVPVSAGSQRIVEGSEADANDFATEKESGAAKKREKRLKGESSVPTPTPPTSDAVASKGDDQKATSEPMRGAGSQLHGVSTIKRISRKIVGTMKGRRFGFILPPKNKTRSNAGP
ncbi:hypothetical protein FRC01_007500 [Tulasnella sp. 417]|nr:hypothetical protein FRC01_007500 [Tulasnella sp. 417]